MTIRSKFAAVALAAVTMTGAFAVTSQEAHASRFGTGLAIGIAAGALVASGAYAHGYHGYYAPVRCHWVKRFDHYGYYIGKERVCY